MSTLPLHTIEGKIREWENICKKVFDNTGTNDCYLYAKCMTYHNNHKLCEHNLITERYFINRRIHSSPTTYQK
jgi:hypothetical protein